MKYEIQNLGMEWPSVDLHRGINEMTLQSDNELRELLTEIMYGADWREDEDLVKAFKPDVEAAMTAVKAREAAREKEANEAGHFWKFAKRLDAWGNEAHFCNCGFKASGSDAIKGHVARKIAQLTQPSNQKSEDSKGFVCLDEDDYQECM